MIHKVTRIIFEKIRLALVANGKLPDITILTDANAYKSALSVIDKPIEIKGFGNYDTKGKLEYDTVLLTNIRTEKGQINKGYIKEKKNETTGDFNKVIGEGITSNLIVDVRLIWSFTNNSELFDDIIREILQEDYIEIPDQGKLTTTLQSLQVLQLGTWTESIYPIKISDISLVTEKVTDTIIPAMNNLNETINLENI